MPQNLGTPANVTAFGNFNPATKPQASTATSISSVTPSFGGFTGTATGYSGFEGRKIKKILKTFINH